MYKSSEYHGDAMCFIERYAVLLVISGCFSELLFATAFKDNKRL